MSEKASTKSGGYEKPLPEFRPETKPYWDACKKHEFSLPRCKKCGKVSFIHVHFAQFVCLRIWN